MVWIAFAGTAGSARTQGSRLREKAVSSTPSSGETLRAEYSTLGMGRRGVLRAACLKDRQRGVYPARYLRAGALLLCVAGLSGDAQSQATQRVCLGSRRDAGPAAHLSQPCQGDTLNYQRDPVVESMIARFGLSDVPISFRACPDGGFAASGGREAGRFKARIHYPLTADRKPNSAHLAPLAHELSHVVQLRQAGSQDALLNALGIRDVELAADFLAGFVISRQDSTTRKDVTDYVSNLDLVGQYITTVDDHGRPLDRTFAFSRGYFYPRNGQEKSADALHLEFHVLILPELKGS